ncbi:MAG: hypothetical protein WC156_08670 [Pedobacter sp.]
MNLFALLPCPLKVPLEEAFNGFLTTLAAEDRANLTFCIEGNANRQLNYADYADGQVGRQRTGEHSSH